MSEPAIHFPLTPEARFGAVACGKKAPVNAVAYDRDAVTCRNCLRSLPPEPVEFTPRYHVNETLKGCPDCSASEPFESCATCGGVGLVYVTGSPSTENDASPT